MSTLRFLGVAGCLLLLPATLHTQADRQAKARDATYIRKAATGAPRWISAKATIARIEKDGNVTTLRQGENDFTCTLLPDGTDAPVCGDKNYWAWFVAACSKQPKPPNTEPGVAYMMQGGSHFEAPDGKIVMEPGQNTHSVKEPPHWMVMWPVDPATSGLPTRPNPMGVYVMFAGTPYAHLMIYQNPATLKAPPAGKSGTR